MHFRDSIYLRFFFKIEWNLSQPTFEDTVSAYGQDVTLNQRPDNIRYHWGSEIQARYMGLFKTGWLIVLKSKLYVSEHLSAKYQMTEIYYRH